MHAPAARVEADTGERIDWFLGEVTAAQAGAIIAWHYLYARYGAWRGRYGLLKGGLGEGEFAAAIESCGVRTNYGRRLFSDIRTRAFPDFESAEPAEVAAQVVDMAEAQRIASELVALYRAGVISGPNDPDAVLHAVRIRDEGVGIIESHTDIAGSDAPALAPASSHPTAASCTPSFAGNELLFGFDGRSG